MKVCIAEKPSVAREIANVLGANRRMDGYYEGNGYQVTWTFGHFCQLKEPEDYRAEWKRWSIHDLPMMPDNFGIKLMRRDDGVVRQFNVIKNLLANAEEVINCGDAGQEGEVIQRWVLTEAKYRKPFKRLWISSLTEEAIRQGFANLRDGAEFDRLYQAGKSRAVGDWLLGLNATRLFTLKYAAGQRQVLSLGRVQTPTLALLVDRYHEIQNFKPEPYWVLRTEYRGTLFSHVAPPKKGKAEDDEPDEKARLKARGYFVSQEEADAAMLAVKDVPLTVTGVEIKKAYESPPSLFDLTSLQVQCNNQLGLSAEDTLKTVQSLYEKKVVSYPRVDTTFLPDDQYAKIPGILRGLGGYQGLTQPLLADKIRKSTKVFNNNKVTDHHAIIPTGASAGGLGGNESSVYDIIVRRFLAAFYPDCEVSNTTVTAEAGGYPFRVRGRQILNPGWRVVYGDPEKQQAPSTPKAATEGDDDVVNTVLPNFVKDESGPHKPRLDQKVTQPPREYTEAMLLRGMETAGRNIDDDELRQAMKENGIGRPSTRAAIIETLFKRGYIRRDKKRIVPTPTGVELIGLIRNPTLKSAELTGQWERKLRQIEGGSLAPDQFLSELKGLVREMVLEVKQDGSGRGITVANAADATSAAGAKGAAVLAKAPAKAATAPAVPGSLGTCPACGEGHVLKGKSAFGCSRWREGCQLRLPTQFEGKNLTDKQIHALLAKGRTPVIKGFIDDLGQKFDAAVRLTPQHTLELVRAAESKPATAEAPQQIPCPVCRLGTMLKGKTAYGCSRFREDCQFRVPLELCGRMLTDAQIVQLLRRGKTGTIRGFVSQRTGQKFEAALTVSPEGRVEFVFDQK
ncbi:type IA DNA topoisomerase [Hymenobacter jejuensis]|uniref:DNA topoisomerase n=1 Tax=Hymenobacter jejuensis TaxID=2502781 RepID=A0A5B7ZUR8_9BACT|nr:type IA DNA topoisomerase [Hymenobacter jejuensis]QDA58871.1 DNA topoisomerase III [Hymenobacter jejuensis]